MRFKFTEKNGAILIMVGSVFLILWQIYFHQYFEFFLGDQNIYLLNLICILNFGTGLYLYLTSKADQ